MDRISPERTALELSKLSWVIAAGLYNDWQTHQDLGVISPGSRRRTPRHAGTRPAIIEFPRQSRAVSSTPSAGSSQMSPHPKYHKREEG